MKVSLDPHSKYHMPDLQIVEACGLVLPWVLEWVSDPSPALPLSSYLEYRYTFPLYPIPGAEIDESETFLFPGDSPLTPLVSLEHNSTQFLMYWHALVAIKDSSTSPYLITRMD